MKYIMIVVCFLYNISFAIANDRGNDNMIQGNVDVLEKHLQEDDRLLDANENIHFIEAIQNESVDENTYMTFPDIPSGNLVLSDKLHFKVSNFSSHKKMDSNNQVIGIIKSFRLVSLSDTNKSFSLHMEECLGHDRYYEARNDFLLGLRATTMTFIPFIRWPENLGTISIATKNSSNRSIIWLYHNLYFDGVGLNLSQEEQLIVLDWVQKQVVKETL
ncbi:hypothetical protein RCS94_03250 [Orbaceae bacterium ac157xtp]